MTNFHKIILAALCMFEMTPQLAASSINVSDSETIDLTNLSGSGTLTKTGRGTLCVSTVLNGSDAIDIQDGTLQVLSGGVLPIGDLTVDTSAILELASPTTLTNPTNFPSGSIPGATTIKNGGTLKIGDNIVVRGATNAVFSSLTMNDGSILKLGNGARLDQDITLDTAIEFIDLDQA